MACHHCHHSDRKPSCVGVHQWVINFQFQSEESSWNIIKQPRNVSLLSLCPQRLPRGAVSQMGAGVGNRRDSMGVHSDIFPKQTGKTGKQKQQQPTSLASGTLSLWYTWRQPISKIPKQQAGLCALGVSK